MLNKLLLPGIVAMGLAIAPALAGDVTAGHLTIESPWSRATAPSQPVGGAFLTIHNHGATPDRLIAASSPIAGGASLHKTVNDNGVVRMRPAQAIEVPALGMVSLEPGSFHIMLMGLTQPLKKGGSIPITLTFEHAGDITIQADILAAGASGTHNHADHEH